jgi:hypothetical protein
MREIRFPAEAEIGRLLKADVQRLGSAAALERRPL